MTEEDHGARIGALEREMTALRQIPEKVAAVSEQVANLSTSLFREVDGLRAQQKSHKDDATKDRDEYQAEVKLALKDQKDWMIKLWDKVNALTMQNAKQDGWKQTLITFGQIIIGLAVIGEAIKVYMK